MAVPTRPSRVHVEQLDTGIEERRSWFTYDLAVPSDESEWGDLHDEVQDVIHELLVDDVYRLGVDTGPGDVWVDAGAHIGLFSIAAMQCGAEVACLIDMAPDLAWCAWQNASGFQRQASMRGHLPSPGITPAVLAERITTARRLVEASMLPAPVWDGRRRSCLKLDVQGSEAEIFDGSGLAELAEAFDLIVFEWHQPDTDHMLPVMEDAGWNIARVQRHVDVLLNCPTSIVWALSG